MDQDFISTPDYEGPERRHKEREEEEESKVALKSRSADRAHSTESMDDQEAITEINVTPLVDVSLVLVIIFMAISPFMLQAGIVVSESKAGASTGKASLEDNVQITLKADGSILLNGETLSSLDALSEKLKISIPKSKDGLVTLQAEKGNHVGQVVEILDTAKQLGAKKVAILNKTEDTDENKN